VNGLLFGPGSWSNPMTAADDEEVAEANTRADRNAATRMDAPDEVTEQRRDPGVIPPNISMPAYLSNWMGRADLLQRAVTLPPSGTVKSKAKMGKEPTQ
jgi:hypothetical protein